MEHFSITYRHIADILSFETSKLQLEKTLSEATFNWDAIVIEGSKQLVLPALYCRLKSKQLLHVLPEELETYLEKITSINRNRNKALLLQVQTIAAIFEEHGIDYVFLKGAALLALGCYEDNGERMMGDIDILVEKSQASEAFTILKNSGYNKTLHFAFDRKNFRHLNRLISDQELAAIELHTDLFNKTYWSLMDMSSVLKSKQLINKVALPSTADLSKHLVLNWQLNDSGHYYNIVSLRSIYDLIAMQLYKDDNFMSTASKLKYEQSFLELAKYYFKDFSQVASNNYMKYIRISYKIISSVKPLRVIVMRVKFLMRFIYIRLYLIFTNKNYTKHLIKLTFGK